MFSCKDSKNLSSKLQLKSAKLFVSSTFNKNVFVSSFSCLEKNCVGQLDTFLVCQQNAFMHCTILFCCVGVAKSVVQKFGVLDSNQMLSTRKNVISFADAGKSKSK